MLKELSIPGSKSLSNRALILASLAEGKTTLQNVADCDDTRFMLEGLRKFGIKVTKKQQLLTIDGTNCDFGKPCSRRIEIYSGNAGTTTRFLTALSTLSGQNVIIDGDERMRERPIEALCQALNKLEASCKTTKGCPPIKIGSKKLIGGKITLPGNISSQYLSALLMVATKAKEKTTITIDKELCSKPYVLMTMDMIEKFGGKVKNNNFEQFTVPADQKLQAVTNLTIESDASSASYPGAYAALHPEISLKLKNINTGSIQGDIKFLEFLQTMGCQIESNNQDTLIHGPKNLKSLGEIDMNTTPDLVMTFAVLAMFSEGTTKLTNIANLKIKETDRLIALENEISKFGIKVSSGTDYLKVNGDPQKLKDLKKSNSPIHIKTYNDHRLAMCFGILIDILPQIEIENPDCVSKSYSTFWSDLTLLQSR